MVAQRCRACNLNLENCQIFSGTTSPPETLACVRGSLLAAAYPRVEEVVN